jgi:hypothetical protein
MTRQTHRLIKDILLITIVLMVIVIVANSQSHGQQAHLRDSGVLLWGGTQGVSSGTVQSFIDLAGSLTNNFEVVATGTAASTLTTTVVGCMPGGTCSSAIASSSGVSSQLMTPAASSGPFQTYKVTLSWTGGDATTAFRINRIGVMARLGGSGSGSGTVSANSGSAGAIAGYASAGGSTTVTPFGMTYSAPTLTISAAGAGNGAVALSGNASGTATITAPSIAGTATNPVTISNILAGPNGAAATPTYGFTGCATCGMYQTGGFLALNSLNNLALQVGGNTAINVFGSAGTTGNTFTNGSGGGSDSGFFRIAAGVFTMGTATGGDETGLLRTANTCRITADVSLTVNTANSFCPFSLPAVAKAWSFRCDIQWAITAGSGTNTFALGVNPAQTPTGTTNVLAQVYTATTGTQTYGSTALSTSGATTVLTGATYTPAATVQLAKISGTILASGTAGTFAITAAANGTTATAAVKAGSVCWLN